MHARGDGSDAARAVVFGATGGIGRALVAALADRGWQVTAVSRGGTAPPGASAGLRADITDEASIVAAARELAGSGPQMVIVATGALTLPGGRGPEKTYRQIDPGTLAEAFAINAIGPALIAKHVLALMPRPQRSVFAALGARVGSIGDNRLGGWYGYRASKAALAMLIRTLAIEHARTHPLGIVVGLHPGTVETALSAPFRNGAASQRMIGAEDAADKLLAVLAGLSPQDSGGVYDWRGEAVPP